MAAIGFTHGMDDDDIQEIGEWFFHFIKFQTVRLAVESTVTAYNDHHRVFGIQLKSISLADFYVRTKWDTETEAKDYKIFDDNAFIINNSYTVINYIPN